MSACCPEPDCRRHYPISIYLADFSGRVFAATKRRVVSEREDGTATFAATERHDVTAQMQEFIKRYPEWIREHLAPSCPCPCSCWSTGVPDDSGEPGWCDACRSNIHSGDRPRPRPVLVKEADSNA